MCAGSLLDFPDPRIADRVENRAERTHAGACCPCVSHRVKESADFRRLEAELDFFEPELLHRVDGRAEEVEVALDNARQHPHQHLVAECPHILDRYRAVVPEDIGLELPACTGRKFGDGEEDAPVGREVMMDNYGRGIDTRRCTRWTEIRFLETRAEPVTPVYDEPAPAECGGARGAARAQ